MKRQNENGHIHIFITKCQWKNVATEGRPRDPLICRQTNYRLHRIAQFGKNCTAVFTCVTTNGHIVPTKLSHHFFVTCRYAILEHNEHEL